MRRLSSEISLAFLSAITHFSYGFCLRPAPKQNLFHTSMKSADKTVPSWSLPYHRPTASHLADNHQIISSSSIITLRGGVDGNVIAGDAQKGNILNTISSLWAAGGVVMILGKSIKRILPIALEPFGSKAPVPLSTFQLG